MRHWHTVGLDIPCQVARLQSLTPLLQATIILSWRLARYNGQALVGRSRGPGSRGSTSRSRAGLRLHPEVRHGAMRRRWCEWEQPHTLSWRSAAADDAEWMSGKVPCSSCSGLDRGFLMEVGPGAGAVRSGHQPDVVVMDELDVARAKTLPHCSSCEPDEKVLPSPSTIARR